MERRESMNNPFQIGPQVFGDSFIGRKEVLNSLRKSIIDSRAKCSKSLVGLTRIGKTSIAKNLVKSLPNSTICIYEDLSEWGTYVELLQSITYNGIKKIKQLNINSNNINEIVDKIQEDNVPWIKLNRAFKEFFEELSQMGVKIILVLDEFDNASRLFTDTKHFELFRTILSEASFNVSALLLSRRHLATIEGATYQSSTFHGIVDTIYLKGFNDDDMEEYYELFEILDLKITEENKRKIEYFAGRSPYLLSIIGHYLIESYKGEDSINIEELFNSKCKAINDYYRDCIEHLKRDDNLRKIIPFVTGPNIGVTPKDKEELINLGYLSLDKTGALTAISEYFETFLTISMLGKISIWEDISQLEKRIKLLIDAELLKIVTHYEVSGSNLNEIQKNILLKTEKITEKEVSKYDSFVYKTGRDYNSDCTYLDVISLTDCFRIISECWGDIFASYFDNTKISEWQHKFDKCAKARNPIAHGHEDYISEYDKIEIDTYCKQIQQKLTNLRKDFTDEDIFLQAKEFSSTIISTEDPDPKLKGSIHKFHIIKRGGLNYEDLHGYFNNQYKGIISSEYLVDKNLNKMIGRELSCKIEEICGDHYLLKPITTD